MTVEFEHRNIFGKALGKKRLFSGSDAILDERAAIIGHGAFSVTPARAAHAESDDVVSFQDCSTGIMPSMSTGLSGELRREEINDAKLRTRRDRLGRYSVVRWRGTIGRDMDEELDRFGRFLPTTASNLAHEITLLVAHGNSSVDLRLIRQK